MYTPILTISGSLLTLNAGEFLFTSIGGRVDTLAPLLGLSLRVYSAIRPLGIPYTPGDTLAVTIPGSVSGFPASAIETIRRVNDLGLEQVALDLIALR